MGDMGIRYIFELTNFKTFSCPVSVKFDKAMCYSGTNTLSLDVQVPRFDPNPVILVCLDVGTKIPNHCIFKFLNKCWISY